MLSVLFATPSFEPVAKGRVTALSFVIIMVVSARLPLPLVVKAPPSG